MLVTYLNLAFEEPILGFITKYNWKQIRGLAVSDGKNKTIYFDKRFSESEVRKAPPFPAWGPYRVCKNEGNNSTWVVSKIIILRVIGGLLKQSGHFSLRGTHCRHFLWSMKPSKKESRERGIFRAGCERSETTTFGFCLNCHLSVRKYLLPMLTNVSRITLGTSFYHQKYFIAYILISLIKRRVQYFVWDHTVSVEFNSNQGQSVPRYRNLLHCSQIASHVISKRNQVKSVLTVKAMYQKPCPFWWETFKIKKINK